VSELPQTDATDDGSAASATYGGAKEGQGAVCTSGGGGGFGPPASQERGFREQRVTEGGQVRTPQFLLARTGRQGRSLCAAGDGQFAQRLVDR